MGQGFMLQINNNTPLNFFVNTLDSYNLTVTPINNIWLTPQAPSTQQMYFETGSAADTGTLWLQTLYINPGATAVAYGKIEIRFDSHSTTEFPGSIYIASFQPLVVPQDPAPVGGTQPPGSNQLFPFMILNKVVGSNTWPFGDISILEVIDPPMPWFPTPNP